MLVRAHVRDAVGLHGSDSAVGVIPSTVAAPNVARRLLFAHLQKKKKTNLGTYLTKVIERLRRQPINFENWRISNLPPPGNYYNTCLLAGVELE